MLKPTTAAQSSVRTLANQALNSTSGLIVRFTVASHGTLPAAKARARGVQTAFNSMRAKDRKAIKDGDGVIITYGSPFDDLVCRLAPMENDAGFTLTLTRCETDTWDLIDIATGLSNVESADAAAHLNAITLAMQDGSATRAQAEEFVRLMGGNYVFSMFPTVFRNLGMI